MSDGRIEFSQRLERVTRRHQALARGYTATLRSDGLIVVEPRRIQFKLPVRGFVLLMVLFMAFKGTLLFALGEDSYRERLVVLSGGSVFEQAGAVIMGIDPVSRGIADLLSVFRG